MIINFVVSSLVTVNWKSFFLPQLAYLLVSSRGNSRMALKKGFWEIFLFVKSSKSTGFAMRLFLLFEFFFFLVFFLLLLLLF